MSEGLLVHQNMCLYESSQQMLTQHVDHHHSQEINLVVMCLDSHVTCQTIDIPTLLIINDHFTEWLRGSREDPPSHEVSELIPIYSYDILVDGYSSQ